MNGRRDDIQGVRGIAVLMILAFHMGLPGPGNFTGPDVFFVVSGFVVTGMLLREWRGTGRIAIGQFYLRRARRLAPALAVVSLATLVAAFFVFSPIGTDQQATADAVAAANTLRANIYFLNHTGGYFQPNAQTNPFLHTWTLSVEEQFYLAFPITLLVAWGIARRMRREYVPASLFALIGLVSLFECIAMSYGHSPRGWTVWGRWIGTYELLPVAFFFPLTRAWEFVLGVVLALVFERRTPGALWRQVAAMGGAALLVVSILVVESANHFPGWEALLPVLATAALIIGGLGGATASSRPVVNRLLALRPLVWLGDRSYSLYLWHWPLIVFARVLYATTPAAPIVAGLVSVVPAALSFRFVEEPIHRRRLWPSLSGSAAVAALSMLGPFVCATVFGAEVNRSWGDPAIAEIRAMATPEHIDVTSGCSTLLPLGDPRRPRCVWDTPASRGTWLLIGDSNAGHFSEAFIAAAHALHYDAEVITFGNCPIVRRSTYQTEACGKFVEDGLAAIVNRQPAYAGVVISNATTGYLNNGSFATGFVHEAPAGAAATRAAEIAGWVASLERAIDMIGSHAPVVVVGATPQFYQVPQCLRPTLFRGPPPECGVWSAEWAAEKRADIMTLERRAVLAHGATYLDEGARLCPTGSGCSAFVDGRMVFRDGVHLSVESAKVFEPDFEATLAQVNARK